MKRVLDVFWYFFKGFFSLRVQSCPVWEAPGSCLGHRDLPGGSAAAEHWRFLHDQSFLGNMFLSRNGYHEIPSLYTKKSFQKAAAPL